MLRWTEAKGQSGHQQERIYKGCLPGENVSVEGRQDFSDQGWKGRKHLGVKAEV